jgi:tetratricopeptide (TPR) repeat protein
LAGSPDGKETGAARFADGTLEAGWLLALLLVPAFFDAYSRHPFDPDKGMVVRLIALVMAAAGIVRILEARPRGPWAVGAVLGIPVLLYLGAGALSTVLSIAPRLSVWGSYERGEGLVTLASYLVVFTALVTRLRRREQRDRAIDAIVAGSVPVTLYGIAQAAGLDPIDWRLTYEEWRVSTTLGNPVFAGSYLVLALPVTLGALLEWRARPASGEGTWRWLRPALYAGAAGLQVAVLALTGSRGPWVGAATGLLAFALLGAALGRRRRLAGGVLALGALALAFVLALNVPDGPLEWARQTRLLGRLGHIFDSGRGRNPGDLARVRVWEGALALARPRDPLPLPDRPDRWAALRPLIGYGPETLQPAFAAVYDGEFARLERRNPVISDHGVSTFSTRVPDRSHNELLDSLVAGGALGALAHLLLAAAVQVFGLRALGLVATRKDHLRLAAFGLGGGALGVLAAGAAPFWGFVGVGLPLGLVAGWMGFVLACAFRAGGAGPARTSPILVALVAALAAHFVDIQLAPAVVTGRLYFWALLGLLVAHSSVPREGREAAEDPVEPEKPPWKGRFVREAVPAGLLAAALAVTLLFDFVALGARQAGPQLAATALGVASVLALVALDAARRPQPRARFVTTALAVAGSASLAFTVVHLAVLLRTSAARNPEELAEALGGVFAGYALSLLALLALLGASLARRAPPAPRRAALRSALRASAVLGLAVAIGVPPALASVGADIMLSFAGAMQARGLNAEALGLFDQAADRAPWEPVNLRSQGEAYLRASRRTSSPVRRPEYLRRAETALSRARDLEPLSPDNHANLARLARWRSEIGGAAETTRSDADQAARDYGAAVRLMPGNALLLDEWAELDFTLRRDFTSAEEKLRRSLRLDPTFDYTYATLGDLYMALAGETSGDPAPYYRRAIDAYAKAWDLRESLKAIVNIAVARERLGQTQQAIDAYEDTLAMAPPLGTSWAYRERLAVLYQRLGDQAWAECQALEAVESAPKNERPALAKRLRSAGLLPGEETRGDGTQGRRTSSGQDRSDNATTTGRH